MKARSHLMPLRGKACEGEESPDAPVQRDPKRGATASGVARKLSKNCSNLCDSVCSLKCRHLRKIALSSSLSKYSSVCPASERYRAAAHTSYSRAALVGASMTKLLKPLCQFLRTWKTIQRISCWLLSVIERGYTLQFRRRPPYFHGVAQSLTLPWNALILRQELYNLLEKGAIERVPASKLESSF